ncbi:hypothetical protein HK097_006344 [Rhizophlyctis rosea]|uniref:Cyclin-dependent kinases regulatory subunit n=1 Tax=Rhizophlyctis rosea TaxID=64517 RepID=A0AAD5X5R7_9FUNG|nr:hypothetical protein HK097_006344 [Rhizophlyctis rosea]
MLGDKAVRRTSSTKKRPSQPQPLNASDAELQLPGPTQQGVKRPAEESDAYDDGLAASQPESSQENGHDAKRQKIVPSPQIAKTIREQYGDLLAMPSLLYNPRVIELCETIFYSARYYDDVYEYRHVHIPKQLLEYIPAKWKGRVLADEEWRSIGILQSPGWVNYMYHAPEPHVFLFRREKNYQEKYLPETISQQSAVSLIPLNLDDEPLEEEAPAGSDSDPYGSPEADQTEALSPVVHVEEEQEESENTPSPSPEPEPQPKRRSGRPRKSNDPSVEKEDVKKQASVAATKQAKGMGRRAMQEVTTTMETGGGRITRSASNGGASQTSVKRELRERKSTGGVSETQGSGGVRKSGRRK